VAEVPQKPWAFFKKRTIHNTRGEPYLVRWILIRTPWFALYLHKILLSDDDRHCHDHPWNFWSLILKGQYRETTQRRVDAGLFALRSRTQRTYKAPALNRKQAEDLHRLDLRHGPVWSLVWCGRRRRDWGFQTDEGWVDHASYLDERFGPENWSET
jgi:hypothetical protein